MSSENLAAFTGDRLRLARFRSGLTIKELAEKVGVTHSSISQYENDRTRPTSATLAKLAMATGVSPGFFRFDRRPVSSGGLDGTHFRSLRSTSKTVRAAAWAWSELVLDVADTLERYVRLPSVNLPEYPLSIEESDNSLIDAAAMLRKSWNLPEGPVGNLISHMEAHGILVTRASIANQGVDAFSHYQGSRPVVVLGPPEKDAARSRFDAAHELGHLVCHPEADPGGNQEHQAHAFAAELLMPRKYMVELLPKRFDLGSYARLKHEWGVSIAALLYRARQLQVISDAAYRKAVVTLNKKYGRKNEPFKLRSFEQPAVLRSAIELIINSTELTIEDLANETCISVEEIEAIINTSYERPNVKINAESHTLSSLDHVGR